MPKKSSLYLITISFISTIGGFLFGYDTAIISGCNIFLESQFELTPAMLGWVVSSALFGTIFGCFLAGGLIDKIGRKKTLIIAASLLTISAIGSMLPPNFTADVGSGYTFIKSREFSLNFLIIFRMIGGVGVGITTAAAPIYISELTPADKRGRYVSFYQLSITLGILLAFLVDWSVLSRAGANAGVLDSAGGDIWSWLFKEELWRGMLGTEIPIAFLFLSLLFLTPESPRWLMEQGRVKEAEEIMTRIGGKEMALMEIEAIKRQPKEQRGGFKEYIKPYLKTARWIGILLPMFAHLSGIAAIMYFAPNIINSSVDSVESSFLGAVLVGVVNALFTFVAIIYIERFGRRKLLLFGITGAFISLIGVATLFALDSPYVIIPLLLYVASFAFSYGPVVWVVVSEIFPTRIRGLAVSIGSLALNLTSFVVTYTNPILIEKISVSNTFFLYAILTLPAIWFTWRFIPETKGKSLEDIEKLWRDK